MNQQDNGEVVEGEVTRESRVPAVPDTDIQPIDLERFQVWAETRQKALATLMDMGIASTQASDWRSMGDVPYPEQAACSAMIAMVGITISPPSRHKETHDDEKGHYYEYILEAEASVPRFGIGPVPVVGRASSRDPFFAERSEYQDGVKVKVLRPQSEVDPGDILAKAYTNLRYRAVKAIVPWVSSITWDDLKRLTGGRVTQEKVGKVHFAEDEGAAAERDEKAGDGGTCPECGKALRLRKRKDGSGTFWGCSGFPDCRYIKPSATEKEAPPPKDESEATALKNTMMEMMAACWPTESGKPNMVLATAWLKEHFKFEKWGAIPTSKLGEICGALAQYLEMLQAEAQEEANAA